LSFTQENETINNSLFWNNLPEQLILVLVCLFGSFPSKVEIVIKTIYNITTDYRKKSNQLITKIQN